MRGLWILLGTVLLAVPAFAQAPPFTPICDGAPCFTSAAPGIISGTVTLTPAGSIGTDASAAPPSAAAQLLLTIAVNANRIGYVIQNQSADQLQVHLDNGTSGASILLLASGGANAPGGSLNWDGMPHTGRIRIYGPNAGAQVGAREW